MLFFESILKAVPKTSRNDRRGPPRFNVHPRFPVKVQLKLGGRDPVAKAGRAKKGDGLDWPARLINLSISGARLQLPRAVEARRGDPCRVEFDVHGYLLNLAGSITYQEANQDAQEFGIAIDTPDLATLRMYEQLVFMVAFGAALQLTEPMHDDDIGYLFERYDGVRASYLKVWRSLDTQEVMAFEFALMDCMVRGQSDRPGVQCFKGADVTTAKAATSGQEAEIRRLYQWVVLNLSPVIPEDVQEFLLSHAD